MAAPKPAPEPKPAPAPKKPIGFVRGLVNFLREVRRGLIWLAGGVFWCIAPIVPEAQSARTMYEATATMEQVAYTVEARNASMESILLARAQVDDKGEWAPKAPQWTAEALPTPELWDLIEPRLPAQIMTYLGGSIMALVLFWMAAHKAKHAQAP